MFYFLIFHTSISASKTIDKKLLTTFLYGSILYLILHGLIKTSTYNIFKYIANYYWSIIIIDILTLVYLTWDIIDYPAFVSKFVDTSIYQSNIKIKDDNVLNNNNSLLDNNYQNLKPILRTTIQENKINDYQELNNTNSYETQPTKKVEFNEIVTEKEIKPPTTASDMGLTQSTSLEELGIIDEIKPDGMDDFLAQNVDTSDHISNISDIDMSEFENNLS